MKNIILGLIIATCVLSFGVVSAEAIKILQQYENSVSIKLIGGQIDVYKYEEKNAVCFVATDLYADKASGRSNSISCFKK